MKCLPTMQKAIEWIEQGLIGQLEIVKVDFYKRELIDPKLAIFNANEGGGLMHDFGVYALAFVTSFLGGMTEIKHCEKRKSTFDIDADWQISLESEGIKALVSLSSNFKGASKAALIGSKGTIEWDAQFNRTNRIVRYDEFGKQQEIFLTEYSSDGFEYEIAEVRRCIKKGLQQSGIVSLEASLATLRLMERLCSEKN